jgi:hypothetical protein
MLADNLAHKVTFTYTNNTKGQYIEKWMQLWTVKDGIEYLVTYVGQPLQYSKYLPIAQQMISTINFSPIKTIIPSNSTANSSSGMADNNSNNTTMSKAIIPGIL